MLSYVFNLLGRVGQIEGAFAPVTNVMCAPVCLCVFVRSCTCVCACVSSQLCCVYVRGFTSGSSAVGTAPTPGGHQMSMERDGLEHAGTSASTTDTHPTLVHSSQLHKNCGDE